VFHSRVAGDILFDMYGVSGSFSSRVKVYKVNIFTRGVFCLMSAKLLGTAGFWPQKSYSLECKGVACSETTMYGDVVLTNSAQFQQADAVKGCS
jgi:hypothetical protein